MNKVIMPNQGTIEANVQEFGQLASDVRLYAELFPRDIGLPRLVGKVLKDTRDECRRLRAKNF